MRATRKWITLLCSAVVFLSCGLAAKEQISPIFYQVNYQGKTAWVLGSFHVGTADFYPLPQQITNAYASSEALVLEVDIRDPSMIGLMRKYGMSPQTPDADTQAALDKFCADKSYCAQFKTLSPWLQALQFSMLRLSQRGYTANYGTEMQLLQTLGERPLLALETPESQFSMMASLSDAAQWAMVREAVSSPDSEIDRLVEAWKHGDEATLSEISNEELQQQGGEEMQKAMLWDRNKVMAQGIIKQLKHVKKPLFVAVGAAHLAGEHSVLNLLQQAGATNTNCNKYKCTLN